MNNRADSFFDLTDSWVWKKSQALALLMYKLADNLPKEERFRLSDQIKRAGSSIPANVAEGFGRYHFKDKSRFYFQARGSVYELQSHLLLIKDLHYCKEQEVDDFICLTNELLRGINGLIKSAKQQS